MDAIQVFELTIDALLGVFLIMEIAHKLFGWTPPGLKK